MKRLSFVLLALIAVSCESLLLDNEETQPLPTIHDSTLATVLDSLRYALDLPALAGAIVTDSGVVDAEAVGCRRYSGPANVTNDDRFHLGSNTKAFTAALVGTLVDEGSLNWTTALPTIFPEHTSSMRPEYRDVTVRDILSHSAGFMRDPSLKLETATPAGRRAEVVAWALTQAPVIRRGTFLYSNLGYIIAGAIIERVTGRPYTELIMERITGPLGITTAGFGTMGTPGQEDQPLQHMASHAPILPTKLAGLDPVYDSAGGLYMSVGDYGRFIHWVLAAEAGHQDLLGEQTARTLTTAVVSDGAGGFVALGWGVSYPDWAGGKSLQHNGSNGANYCTTMLSVPRRFGVIVMTNQGAGAAEWPIGPAIFRLITFHLNGR